MSLTDLDKVIKWLRESNIGFVQLIGGEPTMHPDIIEIVKKLLKNGVHVRTILTNGLADGALIKEVSDLVQTNWLVNINHPSSYTGDEWETINGNLDQLMWRGEDRLISEEPFDLRSLSLQLAINFNEPGMDYRYIIDLAKKYRCSHIRYAPSHPSAGGTNKHVSFDRLLEMKPTIMSFVRDAVAEGIKPGLECILPPCIFTTSEWSYLMRFTEGLKTICPPDLEVMPDLTVNTCVSLMGKLPSYRVGEMSAQKMLEGFLGSTKRLRDVVLPQCKECAIFKAMGCQGYCLRLKSEYAKSGWLGSLLRQ
jgi:cyclic pyranopterin phosphate synthase